MPDLVIEHDPDSGCAGCPLSDLSCYGVDAVFCMGLPSDHASKDTGVTRTATAPDWCPLRTARVVVQRPGGES